MNLPGAWVVVLAATNFAGCPEIPSLATFLVVYGSYGLVSPELLRSRCVLALWLLSISELQRRTLLASPTFL